MKFIANIVTVFIVLVITTQSSAFVLPKGQQQPSLQQQKTLLNVNLDNMSGVTAPLGKFDPLNLSNVGSDETFNWFKASELKHSRVAMLASTGYILQAAGIHFPGYLSSDVTFESLSNGYSNPIDQWSQVPFAGKWQIIAAIGVAEIYAEIQKPHYMMGGSLPTLIWPSIDTSNVGEDVMKVKQSRELNNGRLAMIAIMGFLAEKAIPGAVPVLSGFDVFH